MTNALQYIQEQKRTFAQEICFCFSETQTENRGSRSRRMPSAAAVCTYSWRFLQMFCQRLRPCSWGNRGDTLDSPRYSAKNTAKRYGNRRQQRSFV